MSSLMGRDSEVLALEPALRTGFVPVPEEYSQLIFQAQSAICLAQHTTVKNPAFCLLCGAIVCNQSYCCSTRVSGPNGEKVFGGCSKHAEE